VSSAWWRIRWNECHRDDLAISPRYLRYDAALGWRTYPFLRGWPVGMGADCSTNSRGLRGAEEHSYARRTGRKRLLVLGDSFAFGEEVRDEETFSAQLERLIPGLEVINMGVGGYGDDQMLLYLKEEGRRYNPDMVLLLYNASDAKRNNITFRDYAKPSFEFDGTGLRLIGRPVPSFRMTRLRYVLGSRLVDFLSMLYERLHPPRDRTLLLLDLIRDEASSIGARFAMFSESGRPFQDYCRDRGVDCLTVGFADAGPLPPGYSHWPPAWHASAARQLIPFVEAIMKRPRPGRDAALPSRLAVTRRSRGEARPDAASPNPDKSSMGRPRFADLY